MLKSITFLIITLLSITAFSQKAPMKFGKVPSEDLQMTSYAADSTAEALILGDYGSLAFQFTSEDIGYRVYRHKRIKMLKRSGFDRGDITLAYYSKDNLENIKAIKVKVISPDGEVTDLARKEIFDEKVNNYWSRKRFTCPNLQVGSVIDLEYTIDSKSIFQLPAWQFQTDIPVRWSELRMQIPEWYDYVIINQGRPLDINEKEGGNESYYVSATFGGSGNMSVKTNEYRMVMKEVPALREEAYITTMDDYYARIRFQLSSVRYPNGNFQQVMSNWEEVCEELMNSTQFGQQIDKSRNYKDILAAAQLAVPNDGTPEEKAAAVQQFLLSNIEVNNITSIYAGDDLDKCFEKKSARAGEMNLMLIAVLREYGVEAHPLLVSTRSNGKPLPLYPLLDQFNHVLALINTGEQYIVADASNPFRPIGYPSLRSLNSKAWAVIKGNPTWIDMPTPYGSDTYLLNLDLTEEGSASGDFSMSSDGYSAISERVGAKENPAGEHLQKRLANKFPDAQLSDVNFENQQKLSKPLKAKANCTIPNLAMATGEFIYLSPAILSNFSETPFKVETRLYPVDIPYPFKEQLIVNITVPEGYVAEELPEPIRMALPEKAGSFSYRLTQNGNKVQLISKLQVNRLYFEPEEYSSLRNFFGMVEEKMGEQLVLKKG